MGPVGRRLVQLAAPWSASWSHSVTHGVSGATPQQLICAAHTSQHLMYTSQSHSAQLCMENNDGIVVMQEAQADRLNVDSAP